MFLQLIFGAMGAMLLLVLMLSWEDALLFLSGASTMEELGAEEIERYESLRRQPFDINRAGRSRLLSSGLFSTYQVASLLDYRQRCGDILSFEELALVDGIGERYAEALRYFIRVGEARVGRGTAAASVGSLGGDITLRCGIRGSPLTGSGGTKAQRGNEGFPRDAGSTGTGAQWNFGEWLSAGKMNLSYGERAELNLGGSRALDGTAAASYSAAVYGRGVLGKVVLGDFNARFGQGLALWSGFSMSGVGSVEALRRNPSGVSAASSYNGNSRLRGAAADFSFGRWSLSALGAKDLAALNVGCSSLSGQWSATCLLQGREPVVSTDFKYARGKFDVWGEGAWAFSSRSPAGMLGAGWNPAYKVRLALAVRCYAPDYKVATAGPLRAYSKASDEAGVSLALRTASLLLTGDWCLRSRDSALQGKWLLQYAPSLKIGSCVLVPSLRLQVRDRPGETPLRYRTDLRGDLDFRAGCWQLHGRYETLWYRDRAWAWYAESVYRAERGRTRFSAALRGGLFKVDNWDDRIYVYERDLPGMFTSQARYGRGWNASLVAGCTYSARRLRHRLDLRLSYIAYPWNPAPKPSRAEARVQYSLNWK